MTGRKIKLFFSANVDCPFGDQWVKVLYLYFSLGPPPSKVIFFTDAQLKVATLKNKKRAFALEATTSRKTGSSGRRAHHHPGRPPSNIVSVVVLSSSTTMGTSEFEMLFFLSFNSSDSHSVLWEVGRSGPFRFRPSKAGW